MGKLDTFCEMVKRYADCVDFLIIYVEEAHPTDGWYFTNKYTVASHKTLQDRIESALNLSIDRELPCPLVVDSMDDACQLAYGGHPERLFVIQDGRIIYHGGKGPQNYSLPELEAFLLQHVMKSKRTINGGM